MIRASRRALPALALVTIGLTGLGACGGSELSKADYIAKVDPICAKYETEAQQVATPDTQDANALAGYYDKIAGVAERQVNEFDDAGRPKEGKQQIDDIVKRQRAQIEQIRQLSAALRANDKPKASQISTSAESESTRIQGDLKSFGFTKCGA